MLNGWRLLHSIIIIGGTECNRLYSRSKSSKSGSSSLSFIRFAAFLLLMISDIEATGNPSLVLIALLRPEFLLLAAD